jgi:sigma-B regulation protein RsbU (phosphoserine phosphatase)
MRVLIADDDGVTREVLEEFLSQWGYEVVVANDGDGAWQLLQEQTAPHLIILDWLMPGISGLELCRKVRAAGHPSPAYIILLTVRTAREDIVRGLDAGADDYITKPFHREELRARIQCGVRILELQTGMAGKVRELEEALQCVKVLQGLLPICSYCKRVRNDQDYWQQVETYLSEHSEVRFSHGICPECWEKHVKPELDKSAL